MAARRWQRRSRRLPALPGAKPVSTSYARHTVTTSWSAPNRYYAPSDDLVETFVPVGLRRTGAAGAYPRPPARPGHAEEQHCVGWREVSSAVLVALHLVLAAAVWVLTIGAAVGAERIGSSDRVA